MINEKLDIKEFKANFSQLSTKLKELYARNQNSNDEIYKIDGWVKKLAQATANIEDVVRTNLPLTFQKELKVK